MYLCRYLPFHNVYARRYTPFEYEFVYKKENVERGRTGEENREREIETETERESVCVFVH